MQIATQAIEQRASESKKVGFERWMALAPTRLLMSQITCGDQTQSEILQVLLRDAYERGFCTGEASLGMEMITSMLANKSDKKFD